MTALWEAGQFSVTQITDEDTEALRHHGMVQGLMNLICSRVLNVGLLDLRPRFLFAWPTVHLRSGFGILCSNLVASWYAAQLQCKNNPACFWEAWWFVVHSLIRCLISFQHIHMLRKICRALANYYLPAAKFWLLSLSQTVENHAKMTSVLKYSLLKTPSVVLRASGAGAKFGLFSWTCEEAPDLAADSFTLGPPAHSNWNVRNNRWPWTALCCYGFSLALPSPWSSVCNKLFVGALLVEKPLLCPACLPLLNPVSLCPACRALPAASGLWAQCRRPGTCSGVKSAQRSEGTW